MSSYGPGREARAQPAAPGGRFPRCGGPAAPRRRAERRSLPRSGGCRDRKAVIPTHRGAASRSALGVSQRTASAPGRACPCAVAVPLHRDTGALAAASLQGGRAISSDVPPRPLPGLRQTPV